MHQTTILKKKHLQDIIAYIINNINLVYKQNHTHFAKEINIRQASVTTKIYKKVCVMIIVHKITYGKRKCNMIIAHNKTKLSINDKVIGQN